MTTPPFARYRQVAERLRNAITAGEYAPGEALPSESQLAEELGLNRTTINRAIKLLAAEGLVTIEHGRGSYVRQRRPVIHTSAAYVTRQGQAERAQWTSELQRQGLRGGQELREVTTVAPLAEVAGFLGLEDGEQVVVRRRVMLVEDEPVQLADSYYPARLASGTELADRARLPGGTIAALERLGVRPARFHEQISAHMPTAEQARLLNSPTGIPVIHHVRVSYDSDDMPVEVTEHIMAGDRNVLTFDLPAQL